MTASAVFAVSGLFGMAIMVFGLLLTFPTKATDLTGGQAIVLVGFVVALLGQLFSVLSRQ